MPPRAFLTAEMAFWLASIPVRLHTATSADGIAFHLLHATCGSRVRSQFSCPVCQEVVERCDLVRGYELRQDECVTVTDPELKALEGEASKVINIAAFVPLPKVDPVYFERTYYVGPGKGGERGYRLLTEAMAQQG